MRVIQVLLRSMKRKRHNSSPRWVLLNSIIVYKLQSQNDTVVLSFCFSLHKDLILHLLIHSFALSGLSNPTTNRTAPMSGFQAHNVFSFLTEPDQPFTLHKPHQSPTILHVSGLCILQWRHRTLSLVQSNFWLTLHLDHMLWYSDYNYHTMQNSNYNLCSWSWHSSLIWNVQSLLFCILLYSLSTFSINLTNLVHII